MKLITDTAELVEYVRQNRGVRLRALVPTMGALHEGHLSLMDQARAAVGADGEVMATIFVNPTQFGPNEDFDAYPRVLDADLALCEARGVDVVFAPEKSGMYADDASVKVGESQLSLGLCGGSRPGHFDGVCTVVAKLFNLTQPDIAVFGEKDYQQLAVIRRMVRDLNFPIQIVGGPIVREMDGLAMSSRNAYLTTDQRVEAPVLQRTLHEASLEIQNGEASAAAIEKMIRQSIEQQTTGVVDYIEIVDPDTLQPLVSIVGSATIALAVFFGKTRLIDNITIKKPG